MKLSGQSEPHAKPQSVICLAALCALPISQISVCVAVIAIVIMVRNLGEVSAKRQCLVYWSACHPWSLNIEYQDNTVSCHFL